MWVPGDRVIELGADALSREEGLDWGGYTADAKMWQAVQGLAKTQLRTLTVDLFASSRNNKCPRFFFKIPAKKWGDTEIAERGRSVLVMRARYRSAGLTPHQRGWTDAG